MKTCKDCQHSVAVLGGQGHEMLECRRYPPQMVVVHVPPKVHGGSAGMLKQSGFPNCINTCGEFTQALRVASERH